jgi:hypothetical protein
VIVALYIVLYWILGACIIIENVPRWACLILMVAVPFIVVITEVWREGVMKRGQSKKDWQQLNVRIPPEIYRRFKKQAVDRNESMQEALHRCVLDALVKDVEETRREKQD